MLRDCLKDINLLLVKRDSNFELFVDCDDWAEWPLDLLTILPDTGRSKIEEETFKYLNNFFSMVHFFVFASHGRHIDKAVRRSVALLEAYAGTWLEQVVSVVRTWYLGLISKVGASLKLWKNTFDAPEWSNLYKLTSVIEEFIFYRPVTAIHTTRGTVDGSHPMILTADPCV